MKATFLPSHPHGSVCVPASKSCAHRLLICAAFADGESVIRNVSFSEDILATLDCLRALGTECAINGSTVSIHSGSKRELNPTLPCRESGSTLRFLIPAALLNGGGTFQGTKRLLDRGVGVYESLLRDVRFERASETELRVSGRLNAGEMKIVGNVSSQFISGLLFALPTLENGSVIEVLPPFESRGYVDLTLDAMRRFGVRVQRTGDRFMISGGQKYRPANETVEGDWSQAAFFCAMNALGGEIQIEGLNPESLQGDRVCEKILSDIQNGYAEADLSDCPDLAPVLFAAAAAFGHGARFTGTRRLMIKESNRAAVMQRELAKFGARLIVEENAVAVEKCAIHAPTEILLGSNDHRIVMALSVIAACLGGTIQGAEAVRKSYPDFFEDLRALGVSVELAEGEA